MSIAHRMLSRCVPAHETLIADWHITHRKPCSSPAANSSLAYNSQRMLYSPLDADSSLVSSLYALGVCSCHREASRADVVDEDASLDPTVQGQKHLDISTHSYKKKQKNKRNIRDRGRSEKIPSRERESSSKNFPRIIRCLLVKRTSTPLTTHRCVATQVWVRQHIAR